MEWRSPKSHMMKIPVAKSPAARSPMHKSLMPRSPMHKSLMPRSPMSKSPMLKSPVPRSPVAYEKYKSRCAYGLISFFRFRHHHSKKMISDAYNRTLSRHALDDQPRNSDQYICDAVHEMTVTVDSSTGKPEKIRKDTCIEKQMKKKATTAKVKNAQSDSEHSCDLSSKHRKAAKTSPKPRRLPVYGCYDVSTVQHANSTVQIVAERSLNSLDSPVTVEVHQESRDCISKSNEINLQVNLNEATEAFIKQKLIDGRHYDGSSHESKHLLDALEVLNSNKDLFLRLLQDPNSVLVTHIEDLRDSQEKDQQKKLLTEFKVVEHQVSSTEESSLPNDGDCQPLENIVILKPRQNGMQHCTDKSSLDSSWLWNMQQSVKPFEQMKKKLMQAIRASRKKRQSLLTDSAMNSLGDPEQYVKGRVEDIVSRNSPDEAALDLGELSTSSMDTKRKTLIDEEKESDPSAKDETVSDSKKVLQISCLSPSRLLNSKRHDLFIEPRIDISDLNNGNTNVTRKQRAKTWDGFSFVDYSFLPMISPGRTKENGSVSPQWRFSSYGSPQIGSENHSRNQKDRNGSCSSPRRNVDASPSSVHSNQFEKKTDVPANLYLDVRENKSISSSNISFNEIETNMDEDSERAMTSGMASKSDSSHDVDVNQRNKMTAACEEHQFLSSPRTDSSLETQASNLSLDDYSSSPSNRRNFKEFDIIKDSTEQPSPISVLDQVFTEDANSPVNTKSQPVWQLQIGTEEVCLAAHQSAVGAKIDSISSTEEYGSVLNYISRVLQACHFTWDELLQKSQISDQIVDLSLFEDILVVPPQCFHYHRLLFDYVNEVVLDAFACYLRYSPWLSFIKPSIPPAISMNGKIVDEMMKCVDHDLFIVHDSVTLEKIIGTDFSKSRAWMDVRLEAEETVCEIIDGLFDELTTEFVAAQ